MSHTDDYTSEQVGPPGEEPGTGPKSSESRIDFTGT